MKTITKDSKGIEIKVTALDETCPVRGNALASGDEADDRACEDKIIARLDRGDIWAWCTVKVTVTYRGVLSADEYLGSCSYDSEADFRAAGYFDDMVAECISQINGQLNKLAA